MLKFDFNLLWTVINLVIFFVLMRLFLFKPIKKTLAAREEMLKNKFQQADDTVNEANQKLAEYEEHIANVDEEAKQIVIDAKNQINVLLAKTDGHSAAKNQDFYLYRYLASEGVLPGYSFPRLPVTAWVPRVRST